MPAVLRVGDPLCHGTPPPCLNPTTMASPSVGNPTVKANGKFISVNNDFLVPHGNAPHGPTLGISKIIASRSVRVHGKPVAAVGDTSSCGATPSSGSPNVNVGS